MPSTPQDIYAQAALRGAPPDARPPLARRSEALALLARALALPAALAAAAMAGLGLWQLASDLGLTAMNPETYGLGPRLAGKAVVDAPLVAAAAALAMAATCAAFAGALWTAGGWFRTMGVRPLPRAEASALLARAGRLTGVTGVAQCAYVALSWGWAIAAEGPAWFDLTRLAAALLALLLAAGMRLAAQALVGDPGAN